MNLAYHSPSHLQYVEDLFLHRSIRVYREAITALQHVQTPTALELRVQLAQAVEQLQNELTSRASNAAQALRSAA